jgi:hypothetical protein
MVRTSSALLWSLYELLRPFEGSSCHVLMHDGSIASTACYLPSTALSLPSAARRMASASVLRDLRAMTVYNHVGSPNRNRKGNKG